MAAALRQEGVLVARQSILLVARSRKFTYKTNCGRKCWINDGHLSATHNALWQDVGNALEVIMICGVTADTVRVERVISG